MATPIICPRDHLPLQALACANGHVYQAYDGIPILLRDDIPGTYWIYEVSLKAGRGEWDIADNTDEINAHVQEQVSAAAGSLYAPLIGKLKNYPIPEFPLSGVGASLLDVGCNWGRWTIAAAQQGFRPVGIDCSIGALIAARRIARQLNIDAEFICADARYLPFEDKHFDHAFSFSVLQHFSKHDALLAFEEMRRVSCQSLVEIPGKYGVRALYHQVKRGFREAKDFEVRYWTPRELQEIGSITPHAFFGTGVLLSDVNFLPWYYRPIPYASHLLTKVKPLRKLADSFWVTF